MQTDRLSRLAREILDRYGATLAEFPNPVPPGPLAALIARESGGNRWATTGAAATVTGAEAGLTQSTPDEVERFDFDPFDPRGSIWGAQSSYSANADRISDALHTAHGVALGALESKEQVLWMMLSRSVGIGATRTIAAKCAAREGATPWVKAALWIASPAAEANAAAWGRQTTDKVRLRFRACEDLLRIGHAIVPVPERLETVAARPADMKRKPDGYPANIRALAAKAKREGPQATGPFPSGTAG